MSWKIAAACAGFVAVTAVARADEPPYTGDPDWAMRALLGYTKTSGNTDNSAGNFLFHVAHVTGDWKLLFGAEGLYGSTRGETTAQAWDAHLQADLQHHVALLLVRRACVTTTTASAASPSRSRSRAAPATSSWRPTPPSSPPRSAPATGACARRSW